jgi:DNA-directed RNA polymerase specialized sigma subunit
MHAELRALSDNMLLARLRPLPRGSAEREAVCEILVSRYAGLVHACVRPYLRSPEPAEDLLQVGYVGLLKAINNFDPACGDSLNACAQPCISGEIGTSGTGAGRSGSAARTRNCCWNCGPPRRP